MDKRRIRITAKVLDEVNVRLPETTEFIEEHLKQKCSKENISAEQVIVLFTCLEAKG